MQENVPHLFGYNIFDYLNVMVLTAFAMEGLLKIIVHGPKMHCPWSGWSNTFQ